MNRRDKSQRKKDKRAAARESARRWKPTSGGGLPSPDAVMNRLLSHLSACPDCGKVGRIVVPCEEADRLASKFGGSAHAVPDSWELLAAHVHFHCPACGSVGCINPPEIVKQDGGLAVSAPEITWDERSRPSEAT